MTDASQPPQLDPVLLDLLRCPAALKTMSDDEDARLTPVHNGWWLVCAANGYKYPVRGGIPHMLVTEGEQWQEVAIDDLPVPPPPPEESPEA